MMKKLLTLTMLLVALATGALAKTSSYGVWVGGTEVTSANAANVLGNGTVSYDASTNTLTLNNANITTVCDVFYRNGMWGTVTGIRATGDITITLIGHNTIDLTSWNVAGAMRHAIFSNGNITINGDGYLNAYSGKATNNNSSDYRESTAIHSEKTLTFEGNATVYAEGGPSECDSSGIRGEANPGVVVKGNATVECVGGPVTVKQRSSFGAWCDVRVEGGTLIARGTMYACVNLTVPSGYTIYAGPDQNSLVAQSGTSFNGKDVKCVRVESEPEGIPIIEDWFPDDVFRAYLQQETVDADGNGYLTDEEIANVKTMVLTGLGIYDLHGLVFFTSLENLYCADNNLTTLNLYNMYSLKTVDCSNNRLTRLNFSEEPKSKVSNVKFGGLTPVASLPLENLSCQYNQLTSLNVSMLTSLKSLYCYNNQLEWLDVSGCAQLSELLAACNKLSSLDVTNCTQLFMFSVYQNKFDRNAMGELVQSLPTVDFGFFFPFNSASGDDENVITRSQVATAKEKGWTVQDYNGFEDYDGVLDVIPTEEMTVTLQSGVPIGQDDFTLKEQAALLVLLNDVFRIEFSEEEEITRFYSPEGKLLIVSRMQEDDEFLYVADGVTADDDYTYEISDEMREQYANRYLRLPTDDDEPHPIVLGDLEEVSRVSIAELLAEVKSITLHFEAAPAPEPEPDPTITDDNGNSYTIYDDGTATLVSAKPNDQGVVIIPASVDGHVVDGISPDIDLTGVASVVFEGDVPPVTGATGLSVENALDVYVPAPAFDAYSQSMGGKLGKNSVLHPVVTLSGQWIALFSPTAFTLPADLEAFTVVGLNTDKMCLQLLKQDGVVANVPTLLRQKSASLAAKGSDGAKTAVLSLDAEAVMHELTPVAEVALKTGNNGTLQPATFFQGTAETKQVNATAGKYPFYLDENAFLRDYSRLVKPYECYLLLEYNTTGSISSIPLTVYELMSSDGSATAIGRIAVPVQDADEWFTLGGQRIERPTQPGVYLHENRKVVVR